MAASGAHRVTYSAAVFRAFRLEYRPQARDVMIMTVCQKGACHNAAVGLELVIRGATVVTPGHREAADIGIADGRIAQLGGTMAGTQELDAVGCSRFPAGSTRTRT